MILAEELALVAIRPGSGRHELGTGSQLNACLAGLLVGELLLDGTVGLGTRDDRIELAPGAAVPASPALAAAAEVVADDGPKVKGVLSAMSRGLQRRLGLPTWDLVMGSLVDAGVVGPTTGGCGPSSPSSTPRPATSSSAGSGPPPRTTGRSRPAPRSCSRWLVRRGCWRSSPPSGVAAGTPGTGSTTPSTAPTSSPSGRSCAASSRRRRQQAPLGGHGRGHRRLVLTVFGGWPDAALEFYRRRGPLRRDLGQGPAPTASQLALQV